MSSSLVAFRKNYVQSHGYAGSHRHRTRIAQQYLVPHAISTVALPATGPRLMSRQLDANPLLTIWRLLEKPVKQFDMSLAITVDRNPVATLLVALANSALVATGCGLLTTYARGLPVWLHQLIEDSMGYDMVLIARLLLLVGGAMTALWHLRLWWAAHSYAFGSENAPPRPSSTEAATDSAQSSTSTLADDVVRELSRSWVAVGTFSRFFLVLAATWTLATAAPAVSWDPSSLVSPPLEQLSASTSLPITTLATAGVAWAVAAVLPLLGVLPRFRGSMPALSRTLPVLGPLMVSEICYLCCLATNGPSIFSAASAAIMAIALCGTLLASPLRQRFASTTIAAGDEVAVHITVKSKTGVVVDSTLKGRPLAVRTTANVDEAEQPAPLEVPDNDQSDPPLRFSVFEPILAVILPGSLVGEVKHIEAFNSAGGFENPKLIWWQPKGDVEKKFGYVPEVGATFWFPIGGPKGWLPTQVTAIGNDVVELDANVSLRDQTLQLEIQILSKRT